MNEIGFFRHRIQFSLIPIVIHAFGKILLVCLTLFGSQLFSQPLAEGHSKFLGNIIGGSIPANFDSYWNQVIPENSGKWVSVEIGRDMYEWGGLDAAYNYAIDRDFQYKHHTLIWGQQQPWRWLQTLDSLEQAEEVEEWIRLVGERYPEMDFVDVVNEPLPNHAPPQYKDALGGDGETGWDWVIWCFEKARQYCSDTTKLLLNEYNLLNSNYNTDQIIGIIHLLKERGLIDGIGIQGHYTELRNVQVSTINNNLDKLAATGLPIYISEFEVDLADDNAQLQEYQRIFPVLWEHPGVKGVTLWGYIQYQMWKPNGYLVRADGTERPALQWLREYLSGTDVKESPELIPVDYALYQNCPNPFNPITSISFDLPVKSNIRFVFYNVLGEVVKEIAKGEYEVGHHEIILDAVSLATGVYFYKIEAGGFVGVKKLAIVK